MYYRNSAAGLTSIGSGTGPDGVPLIDYDALPDNVDIPNGGLRTDPWTVSHLYRSAGVTAPNTPDLESVSPSSSSSDTATPATFPARARHRAARVSAWLKDESLTVPAFNGAMVHTFFGGSTASWNSPKLQYSYFRGLRLQIN